MTQTFVLQGRPPTVNHYWLASGKRRFISDRGRQWKLDTFIALSKSGVVKQSSDVELRVTLLFAKKNYGDVDNYLKAILDSLIGVVYDDDKQVRKLVVERVFDKQEQEKVILTVKSL